MANTKISALPAASTITGTEVIPLVQSGTTKAATVTQLLALLVAAAPGNLDTFFEVATQFGLDEATVTTLQALVASKADAASVAATYLTKAAAGTTYVAIPPGGVNGQVLGLVSGQIAWVTPSAGTSSSITITDLGNGTASVVVTGSDTITDLGNGLASITGATVTDLGNGLATAT